MPTSYIAAYNLFVCGHLNLIVIVITVIGQVITYTISSIVFYIDDR